DLDSFPTRRSSDLPVRENISPGYAVAPGPYPAPMATTVYRTIRAPVNASFEERRSVFECWLRRVGSEEEARAVVDEARAVHWDARHHCSAWVLGPDAGLTRS